MDVLLLTKYAGIREHSSRVEFERLKICSSEDQPQHHHGPVQFRQKKCLYFILAQAGLGSDYCAEMLQPIHIIIAIV